VSAKDNPEFGQDPEEFIVRQMAHFLKARLQDFVLISFFFTHGVLLMQALV
jgi:hypothetical protein